ncbi:uncharacterized protein VTP21DRAFT_2852 [Calcarisporiella thermophila]|uniref:uncharacterized protein n=1 Tax=Calcarisporiella thermophila TaxID=911321 RepID=UPI003742FD3A
MFAVKSLAHTLRSSVRHFSATSASRGHVNRAIIIGNVGRDPEVRELRDGRKGAFYTVGTSDSRKDRDGNWVRTTQWHRIMNFSPGAVEWVGKNVRKGALVCIEGSIQYRTMTDAEGKERVQTSILQHEATILRQPQQHSQEDSSASEEHSEPEFTPEETQEHQRQ